MTLKGSVEVQNRPGIFLAKRRDHDSARGAGQSIKTGIPPFRYETIKDYVVLNRENILGRRAE